MLYQQEMLKIVKKSDTITFDEIAEVLHQAHKSNWDKGMHFAAAYCTGDELKEHLGEDGDIYLVLYGEEIAAVGAVKYRIWRKWFCKDELCGDIMMIGVLPKYKGLGLSKRLYHKLEEVAFQRCVLATMNTASGNIVMLNSRLHDGWRYVDYLSHEGTNFYSIMLAKWKDQCPYTKTHCLFKYQSRKVLVKFVKKKNGEYRSWVRYYKLLKGEK